MTKQTNTGWYVLGGIALFVYMATQLSKTNGSSNTATPLVDSSSAPDTASSPEIIISGKN